MYEGRLTAEMRGHCYNDWLLMLAELWGSLVMRNQSPYSCCFWRTFSEHRGSMHLSSTRDASMISLVLSQDEID